MVPPQTEGNFEEGQLIDLVSTHPFAGGSQAKSGGAQGADWKTKHDSARGRYRNIEEWRVESKERILNKHPSCGSEHATQEY